MTPLRKRFLEDMQLHGYSPKTQSCYLGAVVALARHYRKSPDLVTEEQLRQYFLHLTLEKKVARTTATIALCGIKFFFQTTLQRNWTCFKLLRPAKSKKLPVVLSREEVKKILACVRTPVYRVCLTTIYACALRLNEGCCLQIEDLDPARMLLRVAGVKRFVWHLRETQPIPFVRMEVGVCRAAGLGALGVPIDPRL
jgi:site-specific recombinase XerD